MSFSKEATEYVDLLDEDKPIAGQKFACISFISPENVLKDKKLFYFEEFLKKWDFLKSMEKFHQFMHFISYKYKVDFDSVTEDLKSFVAEEKDNLLKTTIEDEYKNFLDESEEKLENEFNIKHNFQTNTRGIKVRGSFPTQEEAEMKCKMLREADPNHDVYVGPVGMWMPWEPEAYKTGRVEYLEKELNDLMHEKVNNEKNAKEEFDNRVREAKQKAIQDNKENAEKTGSTVSQEIDKDGNLINTRHVNFDDIPDEDVAEVTSSANIRSELFDKPDISTKKSD
tara:strand:+ start:586 stop:1434 length:849 start_codon:yes stop_codon:yes gene_type:complete